MEHYLNILFEGAWTACVIPFGHEPTFFSMLSFGGFNMPVAAIFAICGATLGQVINWLIGRLLKGGQRKQKLHLSSERYERAVIIFNKYLVWCLLLSWAPMFKLVVLASGFLGSRFTLVLPLVLIGQAGYYGWFLLPDDLLQSLSQFTHRLP
jgi:membrane protein YqaA with SNARE-associated domain